jgi:hypothetical protein
MLHYDLTVKLWLHRAKLILLWLAGLSICAWLAWQTLTCLIASGHIPGLGSEPVAPLKVTQSPLAPESNLKILVVPPLDRNDRREALPLQLAIENDGANPGELSATAVNGDNCIGLDARRARSSADKTVGNDGVIHVPVGAHASAELAIPVVSDCNRAHLPRSVALQLSYSWQDETPKETGHQGNAPLRSLSGTISTSPITFTSRDAEIKQRALNVAAGLAKDFTWPVLLALLGYLAQSELARRSDREQIFNTLLPSYTELVQTHYMPIARRMQIIGIEADFLVVSKDGAPNLDVAKQRTFCAILLMRRRMQHLFNTKGGIFFRSSVAEELFFSCVTPFYKRFQEATNDRNQCEILAVSLDPAFTLDEAIEKLFSYARAPVTTKLLEGFSKWAVDDKGRTADFQSYLKLNQLGMAVLNFESNRIYFQTDQRGLRGSSNWYFDPPQLEDVPPIGGLPDAKRAEITESFIEYLNGIPKECRLGVAYPHRESVRKTEGAQAGEAKK